MLVFLFFAGTAVLVEARLTDTSNLSRVRKLWFLSPKVRFRLWQSYTLSKFNQPMNLQVEYTILKMRISDLLNNKHILQERSQILFLGGWGSQMFFARILSSSIRLQVPLYLSSRRQCLINCVASESVYFLTKGRLRCFFSHPSKINKPTTVQNQPTFAAVCPDFTHHMSWPEPASTPLLFWCYSALETAVACRRSISIFLTSCYHFFQQRNLNVNFSSSGARDFGSWASGSRCSWSTWCLLQGRHLGSRSQQSY
jgi:hypothetical protein